MINRALFILSSIYYFLATVWSLLPLLHVTSGNNLLLISLEYLVRMSINSTAASLFKAKATCFGLGAQSYTVLGFVDLMMHLTSFVSTIYIKAA